MEDSVCKPDALEGQGDRYILKPYYKISTMEDGTGPFCVVPSTGDVAEMLKDMDEGSFYRVEKIKMNLAEFETLGEFEGF